MRQIFDNIILGIIQWDHILIIVSALDRIARNHYILEILRNNDIKFFNILIIN